MTETLIEAKDLTKYFFLSRKTVVKAVDGLTFSINRGETFGCVGESGCGKTTTGRLLLRLIQPTSGVIHYNRRNVLSLSSGEMRKLRREMQIVFQDPYSSLNPRMTIGSILSFPMGIHNLYQGKRHDRVRELLEMVGMRGSDANRYPHEFSGGQLQRIGIARALAVDPAFIVADEPVSSLDVSVQSQILNLFKELQNRLGLTYIFISHDLSVVQFISHRIAVLYLGKILEQAPADQLYSNPHHPYTESLIEAIPLPDPGREKKKEGRPILKGEVPSPINPPSGCRFHPRCSRKMEICALEEPPFFEVGKDHTVACHLFAQRG